MAEHFKLCHFSYKFPIVIPFSEKQGLADMGKQPFCYGLMLPRNRGG